MDSAIQGRTVTRRQFIQRTAIAAGIAFACRGRTLGTWADDGPRGDFPIGVASGPGENAQTDAVLWTRVGTRMHGESLRWVVSTDEKLRQIVRHGECAAIPARDFTSKALVQGLEPGIDYFYAFRDEAGTHSPVGHFRTFSPPGRPTRIAGAACQKLGDGYYGAWREVAESDFDAVVHLGDYIYESPTARWSLVRSDPTGEATTFREYARKYSTYRLDPDLQAAHGSHSFVVIPDDHEVENDYDRDTNPERRTQAMRAWWAYMPIWPSASDRERVHRHLVHGNTLLISLDGRRYRTPLSIYEGISQRLILGEKQEKWLVDTLQWSKGPKIKWKLICSPSPIAPSGGQNLDTWDGAVHERETILRFIDEHDVPNVLSLEGDLHSFCGASTDNGDEVNPRVIARSIGVGSVTSQTPSPSHKVPLREFVDHSHGYVILTLGDSIATASFRAVDSTKSSPARGVEIARMRIPAFERGFNVDRSSGPASPAKFF